jgi:hypothetical protein
LKNIAEEFSKEFEDLDGEIERDVMGFVGELLKRNAR